MCKKIHTAPLIFYKPLPSTMKPCWSWQKPSGRTSPLYQVEWMDKCCQVPQLDLNYFFTQPVPNSLVVMAALDSPILKPLPKTSSSRDWIYMARRLILPLLYKSEWPTIKLSYLSILLLFFAKFLNLMTSCRKNIRNSSWLWFQKDTSHPEHPSRQPLMTLMGPCMATSISMSAFPSCRFLAFQRSCKIQSRTCSS